MATTSRGQSQPRRLTVTVHACRDLVNKDGFHGKNDVYCRLNIADESKRTTTVDDGGAEPVWVGGEKHSFDRPEGLQTLEVEVLDHDDIGSDDLIGKQSVDLSQYGFEEADEDWSVGEPVWVELAGKKGNKTTGEIQLSYAWAEPQDFSATPAQAQKQGADALADSPPFEYDSPAGGESVAKQLEAAAAEEQEEASRPRDVRVTVMQAADLAKADRFGKNDPYIVLRVNDEELRTQTINDGGRNVMFGISRENPAGEELLFRRCESTTCTVQCWDDDGKLGADDLIGEGTLRLPSLDETEASEAALEGRAGREVWVDLTMEDKKGRAKPAGRVRVVVQAWDAAVQPPPVHPAGEASDSDEEPVTVQDAEDARRQRNKERREEKANASDDVKAALILEDEGLAEAARCERGTWGTPDIVGLLRLLRDEPHCHNPNVVARACGALQVIFDVDRMSRMHLDLRMTQENGIEVLCDAILRHKLSAKVMETGFWVLETLMRDDGPGPAHLWEPHTAPNGSELGILKPYSPEDYTTPGEWGGEQGVAGQEYKVVILAKGMDAEARKVLQENLGSKCDTPTAPARVPPNFVPVGSTGLDMLSGRSFARSFLEALGTATAEEMAKVVTAQAMEELEHREKEKRATKDGKKKKKSGTPDSKKKKKKSSTTPDSKKGARSSGPIHARPGSRGEISTAGSSGGASSLTVDAAGNLADLSEISTPPLTPTDHRGGGGGGGGGGTQEQEISTVSSWAEE